MLKYRRRRGVSGARARGRVRTGFQFVGGLDRVVERLARERVSRHGVDAASEERRIAFAFRAQPVDRRERRRVELFQRSGFGPGDEQRQRGCELVFDFGFAAVDFQPLRPAPGEPAQGGPEKTVADGRARDSRIGERLALAPQVCARGEPREHALDLFEHARVVRVGAQETQQLVQPKHRSRRAQFGALEPCQQCQFRLGAACAVVVPGAFEFAEYPGRHGFALPVIHKLKGRMRGSPAASRLRD